MPARSRLLYRPALLAAASLHYTNSRAKVDEWQRIALLIPLAKADQPPPFDKAIELGGALPELDGSPAEAAGFASLPAAAARKKSHNRWKTMLISELYRQRPLTVWKCGEHKLYSRAHESEGEFRGRLHELAREKRDLSLEKLRAKYAPKLARIQDQIRRAAEKVERERDQFQGQSVQTAISVGATVLGALFGRKLGSVGNIGRATTAMRGAGRAARQRGDIARAEAGVEAAQEKLAAMEEELSERLEEIKEEFAAENLDCEQLSITPKKSEISIDRFALVWTPWSIDADGIAEPAY